MLDENLPTFLFRPMPETPNSAVVYFTRSGSEPEPSYVLRLADPVSQPACRGVYAAALTDPFLSSDLIYAEAAVQPQWEQPALTAAELRELRERHGGDAAVPAVPKLPDTFSVQLYNPDAAVLFRWTPGSWNKTESWEFAVPTQSFRLPSASRLDRGNGEADATAAALAPKTVFRWKRDGRLGNKDMTCYMVGHAGGGGSGGGLSSRRKEPDITVALFKHGRDPAVTIYEPNLHRVDVQDSKGLELVLLLGAQIIRDLYLVQRSDPFHLEGGTGATAGATASRRKNSRPSASPIEPPVATLRNGRAGSMGASGAAAAAPASAAAAAAAPSAAAIDAETKRLQAMLEREERERAKRVQEEEARIKRMLEQEEKEQRRREAEIASETERLRRLYGMEGQDLPSGKALPPTPPPPPPPQQQQQQQQQQNRPPPHLPPRPLSAGPRPSAHASHAPRPGCPGLHYRPGAGPASAAHNPRASVSNFFSSLASSSAQRHRSSSQDETARNRMQKKRSIFF